MNKIQIIIKRKALGIIKKTYKLKLENLRISIKLILDKHELKFNQRLKK